MAHQSKVAAFLTFHVERSPKLQQQIAEEAGLQKQNIISMMKTGVTKLPMARIPDMAKALDVDPKKLFQLAIEEYMPDLANVIAEVSDCKMILSTNEEKIIKKIRSLSKNTDPKLWARNEDYLKSFVEQG